MSLPEAAERRRKEPGLGEVSGAAGEAVAIPQHSDAPRAKGASKVGEMHLEPRRCVHPHDRSTRRQLGARRSADGPRRRRTILKITGRVVEEMTEWANRPLDPMYPLLFIYETVVTAGGGPLRSEPFCVIIRFGPAWPAPPGHRVAGRPARQGPLSNEMDTGL